MSKLITAKVLSERKYGDKDKVKIIVPSRVSPEIYDNDGIDPNNENNDYTQEAMVACNNNLAKDDLVWISYLDKDKTQPVIVSPYWGKTDSDNFNENPGKDPSDPNTDLLECGVKLADLGVVIMSYGEATQPISKLNQDDIKGMIKDEFYAMCDGKTAIGIRQWTDGSDSNRATKAYKYIYEETKDRAKKLGGTGKLSRDSVNTVKKVISSEDGREAQYNYALNDDPTEPISKLIDSIVKQGIKDNACILYFMDICNQYGAGMENKNRKKFIKAYKDLSKKNLKNFHNKMMSMDPGTYASRRKNTYKNVKMMQDAGWLKGKAGNLENVFDNDDGANEKTGWVFPISDKDGKFKLDQKWRYKDGVRFAHKDGKSEGKKAVAMYKGKVKKVEVVGQSYTIGVELRTKNSNEKHYVEYHSLYSKSVKEGDNLNKNDTIGTLNSNGLLIKVHKNKSKSSSYVNPEEYIGSNVVFGGGGGFGGNPDKFIWYYQWIGGYYYKHNYGSAIGNNSQAACGIFSLAMAWTNFSGNYKSYIPTKMSNGKGTGIAQKWGAIARDGNLRGNNDSGISKATNSHKKQLGCTAKYYGKGLSVKKVKSVLNKGGILLCRIGEGTLGYQGHFLDITGMTKSGKLILADPGKKSTAYYKYKDAGGKGSVKGTSHGVSTDWLSRVTYYYTFLPYKG